MRFHAGRMRRLCAAGTVACLALVGLVTVGSGAAAAAAACNGPGVKIGTIANLSNPLAGLGPEVPASVEAALKVINKKCQFGGKATLVVCDTKFDANGATACGRQMVSEGVLAVVGTFDGFGDQWMPILAAAKIPVVGNNATSGSELTSPYCFPVFTPTVEVIGGITGMVSTGRKKIAMMALDLPSVRNFVGLAAPQVTRLGGTLVATIYVPVTATDMSTYVAQAVAAGANGLISIDSNPHVEGVMKSLDQQGIGPDRLQVAMGLPVALPENLKRLGTSVIGETTNYQGASIDDLSNPGIRQYRKEMKKAKSSDLVTPIGLIPWTMMHVVADLMEGSATMDSATLFNKLNTAKINRPEMVPVDFSKPAFAGDPNFGQSLGVLRIFSRQLQFWEIVKGGKAAPITGFVDATEIFKPHKPKKV